MAYRIFIDGQAGTTGLDIHARLASRSEFELVEIDPDLRKDMKQDFDRRTEGFKYTSPLPDIIQEPVSLPDDMRKYSTIMELKEAIINATADHQLVPDHDHVHGVSGN